ncbi:MAG: DMT family transporter [Bauldia sp.]|nr:DMT family transporter [Bauldia sp.]
MLYLNMILAMVMGATISLYVPMIAQSARIMGSPVMGNVPFFAVALVTSVVITWLSGGRLSDFSRITQVPAWLFVAGILSAVMIVGSSYLVPRIGTGALFVGMVAGQIILGMVINQIGFLNVPVQPITALKAFGAAMVIGGAAIVTFAKG